MEDCLYQFFEVSLNLLEEKNAYGTVLSLTFFEKYLSLTSGSEDEEDGTNSATNSAGTKSNIADDLDANLLAAK